MSQTLAPPCLAIVASDVEKGFGTGSNRQPILRGISLNVHAGETLYLVGHSGSGKTTLLSILGGLLTPDRGSVHVLGQDLGRLSPAERTAFRKRSVSFIFQSFNLFPSLSALDNIRLALVVRGVPRRATAARAMSLLERVGLAARARLRPTQLSTGECQRVAIARALAADPVLIFADEPTASLDADNGQLAMNLLCGLARDHEVTLVVVTHDDRIFRYADRILRLEDGRLAGEWGKETTS